MGSGDAYAWWTISGTFSELYLEVDETTVAFVPEHEAVIPCQTRELKTGPIKLPPLPDLPDLPATGLSGEERRKETRLIKIACDNDYLIGLTNKGHVLKLNGVDREGDTRVWHYVGKNICVLVPFLKLWYAAAKILRDGQDQGEFSLPSNYGWWSEKTAASGTILRHPVHHPRKQHRPDPPRVPGLKIS